MSALTVAFVGTLAYKFSVLLPIFQEHLEEQEGEVLPHLFMAEIERWTERAVASGDTARRGQVQSLLDFLETAYLTGEEEIEELISVSFLEHLPRPGESGAELRSMTGPVLLQQLRIIG